MKKTVIGLLAHVDAGKTTLSEGMLYLSGAVRKLGRVDRRDAFLDTHAIEKERGITIFSKQAQLMCGDTYVTLLDTPGHVDFSTETERVLSVLDYVILVINASDGVQSHTETLWRLIRKYGIPAFLFINKMDICTAERADLLKNIQKRLGDGFVDFTDDKSGDFFENAALCDEALMDEFLSRGTIDTDMLKRAIKACRIFPCYFGSALKTDGVAEFMHGIDRYTNEAEPRTCDFGARVFKIADDGQGNRLTFARITSGAVHVRDSVSGVLPDGSEWSEKINQIRIYSGAKFKTADEATPGTVCAFTGLSKTFAGEGLGAECDSAAPTIEPVMTYSVKLPPNAEVHTAYRNLKTLESEDPQLHICFDERFGEINIQLMGEVQTEVLQRLISERFGIDVTFDSGRIIYKETISAPVEGVGHYEPLKHYAEVHLLLEPLPRGKGLVFAADCSEDVLDKNRQALVLTHLGEKTHIGVLTGSPITDMKITLIAGRAHQKHTEGGDFRQATYRAVRQGLKSAESILLEPWYEFRAEIPTDNVGRFMNDIQQMHGEFLPPHTDGDATVICGKAPVSEMISYHSELIGYTHGRGRLSLSVKGYAPCHDAERVINDIGYDFESDTENTADSVFCSHGAGFLVKWNEVPDYMHVESGFGKDTEDSAEANADRQRAREYIDRVAENKELIKIFEQTYGPIRRRTAEKSAKKITAVPSAVKSGGKRNVSKPKEDYLLVDGYNIIFAWGRLKNAANENLDLARSKLTNILCNYAGFHSCNVILVFDAYKVKGNHGEVEKMNNISVVYTKEAETADTYIERVTHELSREYNVRVATSDNIEQLIILGNGAYRISADTFLKEVEATERAIKEFLGNM